MYVPSSKMRPQWMLLDFDARLRVPGVHRHRVMGRRLVTYRGEGGELHVADEACPHRGASLAEGGVVGDAVVCPYHSRACSVRSDPARFYEFAVLQGLVWVDLASNVITQHFMPPYYPELSCPDYDTHRSSMVAHVNPVLLMEHLIDRRTEHASPTGPPPQGGPYGLERRMHQTPVGPVAVDVAYSVPFTCSRRYVVEDKTVLLVVNSVLPVSHGTCRMHVVRALAKAGDAKVVRAVEDLERDHVPRVGLLSNADPSQWSHNALGPDDAFVKAYREAMALFFPEMLRFCVT